MTSLQGLVQKICLKTGYNQIEAFALLEFIFKLKKSELICLNTHALEAKIDEINKLIILIQSTNKPLAYIVKQVPFLNLNLTIHPPILIPRPETEQWTNQVIDACKETKNNRLKILDIATGSGCIALALAKNIPSAEIMGTDIDPQAITLATRNCSNLDIKNATFIISDLFENLENQKFDLIVSNPPYIDPAKKNSLSPSVLDWENHQALFAQKAGLEIIEKIFQSAKNHIKIPTILPYQLIIEFDSDQADLIMQMAQSYSWRCTIKNDLFGNNRTAWCSIK